MTTHNRNHGPRACREHAKRIALIMQQNLQQARPKFLDAMPARWRAPHSLVDLSHRMGMKKDLYPHGSRELVDPKWVTDKPMTRKLRGSA